MLLAPLLEALQLILEWGRAALDWLLRLLWPSALVTLDGGRRVQVKKRLAEGGFAYVFLVTDAQTGEVCALKKILCQTREQLEAAKREILYHREFRHPNLLPLLDAAILQEPQQGATAIHAYLLFPFCTGGSLRDALNHRLGLDIGTPRTGSTPVPNPWPERQLLRLFRGVVLGVRELHQHKPALAHRDIKPENVLLHADGQTPVLIDFGSMAAAEVRITSRSEALLVQEDAAMHSTIPYRAPELFDPSDVLDARVDVWALGCLLFAMMFGYSPFECDFPDGAVRPRVVECSYLRVIGRVPFPARHPYSPRLVETVGWILRQDPKQRPYVTDVLRRVEELISAAPPDPVGGGSLGLSSSSSSLGSKAVPGASPEGSVALEMTSLAGGAR